MNPPRPLSVAEVAAILGASDAYVRRLLLTQRLFGVKVGPVWAVYPDDLDSFQRVRRSPGRPRRTKLQLNEETSTRERIDAERTSARSEAGRLKPRRL